MKFLILFISLSTFAHSNLDELFEERFYSNYISGKCGDNITSFVAEAKKNKYDLHNASIIEITNAGFSVFGLLNVEFARESGRLNPEFPASGFRNLPGERNWYHHVIFEKDGYIYDFDFGNAPQVTPRDDYFEKMFLNEKRKSEGGEFYVGREGKLKDYKFLIRSALETILSRENNVKLPEGIEFKFSEYLKN